VVIVGRGKKGLLGIRNVLCIGVGTFILHSLCKFTEVCTCILFCMHLSKKKKIVISIELAELQYTKGNETLNNEYGGLKCSCW
jgi:hypothetical protein